MLNWVEVLLQPVSNHIIAPPIYFSTSYSNYSHSSQITNYLTNSQYWYPCPVIEASHQGILIKLIKPCFHLILIDNYLIDGYYSTELCEFFWIPNHPNLVKPLLQPRYCLQCGWYCQQRCVGWLKKYYRLNSW